MRRKMSKNLTNSLLKERARQERETDSAVQTVDASRSAKQEEMKNKNLVKLSPYEYKRHVKAKNILIECVGVTSKALQDGVISETQAMSLQIEGAKKAIRTTNINIAVRAWGEVFLRLISLKDGMSNGVKIKFDWMMDHMRKFGGSYINEAFTQENAMDLELPEVEIEQQETAV
jgi:hypothetical protein